jgi:hypothetical protein
MSSTRQHACNGRLRTADFRGKQVSQKKMSLMERIYLPAMVGGLFITIKHFFRLKRPTIQYPGTATPDQQDLPWPARAEARRARAASAAHPAACAP